MSPRRRWKRPPEAGRKVLSTTGGRRAYHTSAMTSDFDPLGPRPPLTIIRTRPPFEPRARSGVLPMLVTAFIAVAITIVVWKYFLAPTLQPAPESRQVTPAGNLAEDEKSTIGLFKSTGPSVVFITTIRQQLDF